MVERNSKWESEDTIVRAYNVGKGVYYITNKYIGDSRFYVLYWPDRRKYRNNETETVSIMDSFEDKEEAVNFLEKKVEELQG